MLLFYSMVYPFEGTTKFYKLSSHYSFMVSNKPLSQMRSEVTEGDLVRLHLHGQNNHYVGYVWHTSRADFDSTHRIYPSSGYWLPIFGLKNCDVFLCPSSPYGIEIEEGDRYDDFGIGNSIQMVGIDTSRAIFARRVPIKGYEIIERCSPDKHEMLH